MDKLSNLEKMVLDKLTAGNSSSFIALRSQVGFLNVISRDRSPVGFYTKFSINTSKLQTLDNLSFKFGDVLAKLEGMESEVGFLLYVEDGIISMLEGYSFGEDWPAHETIKDVFYDSKDKIRNEDDLPLELTKS